MKNLFKKRAQKLKPKLLFVLCLCFGTMFAQEKQQDSTKTEKLDEVLVKAVRVDAKSPITHTNVTKKEDGVITEAYAMK